MISPEIGWIIFATALLAVSGLITTASIGRLQKRVDKLEQKLGEGSR